MSTPYTPNALFTLSTTSSQRFGPRLGNFQLKRQNNESIKLETPNFIATTSKGVVRHLSKDHLDESQGIQWVHVPFESFLEQTPPVLTLQPNEASPLHNFLGYTPSRHIVSLSIRDPSDTRDLPTNGQDHVAALCVRGVRKVSPANWHAFSTACKPDLVVALSDIPTKPPFSQKRVTKSIYRSTAWIADFLRPVPDGERFNTLVHMSGGIIPAARHAFAYSLAETLHDHEAKKVFPLKRLDEGLAGYVFNLAPLRHAVLLAPQSIAAAKKSVDTTELIPLFKASLEPLSADKLRIAHTAISPHEILLLIKEVGVDMFDSHWAQHAADIGIALDFRFPIPSGDDSTSHIRRVNDASNKQELGHNLYDPVYARDFSQLADVFLDGKSAINQISSHVCHCGACSPLSPLSNISHSVVDEMSYVGYKPAEVLSPHTRAYLHHLLQTHEMGTHALLAMHNFAVLAAFFAGIRASSKAGAFEKDVKEFCEFYDESFQLFADASSACTEVDSARGKGRLHRKEEE